MGRGIARRYHNFEDYMNFLNNVLLANEDKEK